MSPANLVPRAFVLNKGSGPIRSKNEPYRPRTEFAVNRIEVYRPGEIETYDNWTTMNLAASFLAMTDAPSLLVRVSLPLSFLLDTMWNNIMIYMILYSIFINSLQHIF